LLSSTVMQDLRANGLAWSRASISWLVGSHSWVRSGLVRSQSKIDATVKVAS